MMKKKEVRILLVGEPGVGKTSLILSLVSEEFSQDVPPRAEEITIPADVTPERIPTHIVDYSSQEQDEMILEEEINKAHVVCIVYSVVSDDTMDKITSYWLPFIRERLGESHNTPIVLVGNKADLVEYSSLDFILPIMNEFSEIETCVECSAKSLKNVSELFYYAQKAVLHPISPLYITETRSLSDTCKAALTRIFKICDLDNDSLLSDSEINYFQKRCFNAPLNASAVKDIKEIVKKNINDGIVSNSLTLNGFLFLHTLFIQRGRHETTWTVLRKFGYSDNLCLKPEYVFPQIHVPPGSSTELSELGFEFFERLFDKYDGDHDGFLSPTEVSNMFSICPNIPWGPELPNIVETNSEGWISRKGFICYWVLTTLLSIQRTLEYLALLGYVEDPEKPQTSAIVVTREKRIDLQKHQSTRNVYQCQVIGPQGAGKTSFMQAFLNRSLDRQDNFIYRFPPSDYAINIVSIYGKTKYLVLHEIDLFTLDSGISTLERFSDAVCLVYDSTYPKSFEYVAKIYEKYFSSIQRGVPALIVAAKADEPIVNQEFFLQPEEFCEKQKLTPPQLFSANGKIRNEVYLKLATMAVYPYIQQIPMYTQMCSWLRAGISITTIALVSLFLVKLLQNNR